MDTLTLTWINSLFLIAGTVALVLNLVSLLRESRRHGVLLRDTVEAQRTMADALRLLADRIHRAMKGRPGRLFLLTHAARPS